MSISMSAAPARLWLGWAVPGGLVGERRVVPRCPRCLWRGALQWAFFQGALEVS